MKFLITFLCLLLILVSLSPSQLLTVAEKSDYSQTSLYSDVITFLYQVQKQSPKIKIVPLATTIENRLIPMAVVSLEGISSLYEQRMVGKPVVLIMANIHAGEVEGKESSLMLLREIAEGKLDHLLKNQIILIIPIFNADGNDKLSENNRGDDGPKEAGIRANGQNLDLNRDYMKLESPEVKALVRLFNTWDPILTVDMHTTNGSYHRNPVTYSTAASPNSDLPMIDYMWNKLFPKVNQILKQKYGYDSIPYGNFIDRADPEKGWESDAFDPLYGSNYVGLRNRFTILDENYSHADFKTRVLSSLAFIKSILEYTGEHISEMEKIAHQGDINTSRNYYRQSFSLEYEIVKLLSLTVKSYEFIKEKIKPEDKDKYPPWIKDFIVKKTDKNRDYQLPYLAKAITKRSIPLPYGYIIPFHLTEIVQKLTSHGIIVEKVVAPFQAKVEQYVFKELKQAERIYQGHISITPKGEYQTLNIEIPANAYFVPMKQPLARLIPELLEPEASSSLLVWGFFNRYIVPQWSMRFEPYPVYRLLDDSIQIQTIQEPGE